MNQVSGIGVSLAGALAVLLAWASVAIAGDYYVYSCSTYGNTASAFTPYSNAAHLAPSDECMQPAPGGGYRSLEINDIQNSVQHGYGANWTAHAPAGVSIVAAYTPVNAVLVDCNLSSDGFTAEYFWNGGKQSLNYVNGCGSDGLGYADGVTTSFAPSSYFGWGAGCWLKSSCSSPASGGAVLGVHGVRLTAQENTGPSLDAVPASNLWYPNGWVRGPWPITLDASDPSGVCVMTTVVDGQAVESWSDPSRDTSRFVQCHGSQLPGQLNTTNYSNGQHTLTFGASNAASVISAPSKTISIDNAPISLTLSGPTDALSTAGTQYVHAAASAGPSGVGAIFCSVDGGTYQRFGGSAAQAPVSGVGPHRVDCFAANNAVDPSGAPATSPIQTWSLTIREPTVAVASFVGVAGRLRCHRVRKRVHVPGRWVTVVFHHKRVRARLPGHWRTVEVTRCRRPRLVARPARRVAFGHRTMVSGWLGLSNGTALAGQSVRLYAALDDGHNHYAPFAEVRTAGNGSWSVRLPAGPSRLIVAVYSGSSTTEPVVSSAVRLLVPAKLTLKVRPTRTHWGGTIKLTGRVFGGHVPPAEKLLRLRIGIAGVKQTFGIADVRPDGRFHTTFRFSPGNGTVRYWFSVSTLRVANYPFEPASSRRVTVTVGPG